MRRMIAGVVAATMVLTVLTAVTPPGPAGADTTAVAFTCDLPAAQGGVAAGLIPDTVPLNNDITINDNPDPVAPGGSVHYDLDVPFPDLTGDLPDLGFPLGYVYIRQIDITQPIPAGLDPNSVTVSLSPDPSWASVSRVGSNIVIQIKSAYNVVNDTNGRIRVNADVTPTTIEVQETNGAWVPIDIIPSVDVDGTVNGAAGSTIDWKPPSINAKLFYKKFIIVIININWNDVNTPCIPDNPNQTVVSTLIGSPAMTVAATADESSVNAGQPIHLDVTVTNTGNMALTGVSVNDPNAPGCSGSIGTIAVGASATRECTVTTSAANIPTFSNSATADSNETAPVGSNTVNVTVNPAVSTGAVDGTVTATGSGAPIGGAWIAVLRTGDFSIAGAAVANGSGDYHADVAPGSYFVYAVDPAGLHTAGFFGSPTQVNVTGGNTADADPALAPTRGTVAGTVTEQGSGTPIPNALAISLSGQTGGPEIVNVANGSGQYALTNLKPGNHFVGWVDPTGGHVTQFAPASPNVPDSSPVAVSAGNVTTANGALPTKPLDPGGSSLTGTVTEQGTGAPLANVSVIAMHAGDYSLARATTTNGSGQYNLNVSAGDYKLVFIDQTGTHDMEWHDNQPFYGIGSAASVTAPTATNAALDRRTGAMSGTVTDQGSGAPIEGAWVIAINNQGIAGGAVTGPNGTYTLSGLPAGTYRATIADPLGGRTQEYWDNSPDFGGSTSFSVTAGGNTTISAALSHP